MADTIVCPALQDYLDNQDCMENFAGVGTVVYVFQKEDLAAPMELTDNVYSTPTFKSGKGMYKIVCKDESQEITSESLGKKKGFKLGVNFTIEAVNKITSKMNRAINNLDLGIIIPDGSDNQIAYDPQRKVTFASGGIKDTTGKAATDERKTDLAGVLQPVLYSHLYVTEPTTGGWDSLLASAAIPPAG